MRKQNHDLCWAMSELTYVLPMNWLQQYAYIHIGYTTLHDLVFLLDHLPTCITGHLPCLMQCFLFITYPRSMTSMNRTDACQTIDPRHSTAVISIIKICCPSVNIINLFCRFICKSESKSDITDVGVAIKTPQLFLAF